MAADCPYLESAGCGKLTDVVPCADLGNDMTCIKGSFSVFIETRALSYLDKFDLVMLTEQMSESIVLTANVLGYPVEELGTVKLKSCEQQAYNYSTEELQILVKVFKGGMMFYNLAVKEFTRRKNKLSENFVGNQVAKLNKSNSFTEEVCEYRYIAPNESNNEDQSKFFITVK